MTIIELEIRGAWDRTGEGCHQRVTVVDLLLQKLSCTPIKQLLLLCRACRVTPANRTHTKSFPLLLSPCQGSERREHTLCQPQGTWESFPHLPLAFGTWGQLMDFLPSSVTAPFLVDHASFRSRRTNAQVEGTLASLCPVTQTTYLNCSYSFVLSTGHTTAVCLARYQTSLF